MDFNIETYAERTSFERKKKPSKIHNNFQWLQSEDTFVKLQNTRRY